MGFIIFIALLLLQYNQFAYCFLLKPVSHDSQHIPVNSFKKYIAVFTSSIGITFNVGNNHLNIASAAASSISITNSQNSYDIIKQPSSSSSSLTSSLLVSENGEEYSVLNKLKQATSSTATDLGTSKNSKNVIDLARDKVLTLKAYLDEAERDLLLRNWDQLAVYLYTFTEQESSFAALIDGLFPADDILDNSARTALTFEAQSMFLTLEEFKDAARNKEIDASSKAYARLLLSYDRFLKAGDLYPTYDPFTSTEIFFTATKTPEGSLRYDSNRVPQTLDRVLFKKGPDMGKTGTVLDIDDRTSAIVKLDKDGKDYQEVKVVKLDFLGKTLSEDDDEYSKNQAKTQNKPPSSIAVLSRKS